MLSKVYIFTPNAFSIRKRHRRRQSGIAVGEAGEGGAAHAQHLRRLAHGQANFIDNSIADERAGVRRGDPYSGGYAAHY